MKTIEKLEEYFESEIKDNLEDLEKWRIRTRIKRIIKAIIFFLSIIAIPVIYFFVQLIKYSVDVDIILHNIYIGAMYTLFLGDFTIILIYIKVWRVIKSPWKKQAKDIVFKNKVIKRIVKFISPNLNFSPYEKEVSGKEFLESGIFRHSIFYPTGYYAEDFVEGKLGKVKIRFYEIDGKDPIFPYTGKKTYDGRVEKISFYGMFFIADFNKSFNGHTLVLPEKRINRLQWITASGRKPVKLDDPEFEKLFSVHGTDQIMARYVLSNSLMQRIVKYRKKIGRKVYMSFSNNKLYIAIKQKKNKFELELNKSVYDFNRVKEFYNDLKITIDIVEDLNLNTQIWLKEDKENSLLYKKSIDYKYRKKKVYKTLSNTLGLFGIHYFYIGHRGKGIITMLISLTIFPLLILFLTHVHEDNIILPAVLLLITVITWPSLISTFATWVRHDSKGYPLV